MAVNKTRQGTTHKTVRAQEHVLAKVRVAFASNNNVILYLNSLNINSNKQI